MTRKQSGGGEGVRSGGVVWVHIIWEPGHEELGLKEDITSVITESDGDESTGLKGHTNSLITESDGDELWDLKRT